MELSNQTPWDTEIAAAQLDLDEAMDVLQRATVIARYHQERLDRLNVERLRYLGQEMLHDTVLSD